MQSSLRWLWGLLLLLPVSGCASAAAHAPKWGEATQLIDVRSEPSGANVLLNGKLVGTTPVRVPVKRSGSQVTLHIEKDGFGSTDVMLHRSLSKWLLGDAALMLYSVHPNGFGDNPDSAQRKIIIGAAASATAFAIDFANGSAFAFPSRVSVTLKTVP